jgi:DNA-binding MarR family transcriptional regulator
MSSVRSSNRDRRRRQSEIKDSLRELGNQLRLLNYNVSGKLSMKDIDLDCLDIVQRHGPLSPSALSRRTGLHPATMTGILDRLERGGWIARERDPADRRAVLLRAERGRGAEIFRLYAGMNAAMDGICDTYDDAELDVLADFLQRCVAAGRSATETLTTPDGDGTRSAA